MDTPITDPRSQAIQKALRERHSKRDSVKPLTPNTVPRVSPEPSTQASKVASPGKDRSDSLQTDHLESLLRKAIARTNAKQQGEALTVLPPVKRKG